MESARFATITRALRITTSRRLSCGLALAGMLWPGAAAQGKKRRRKRRKKPTNPCARGYTKCGGTKQHPLCVDLSRDLNHCGFCGNVCSPTGCCLRGGCAVCD